MAPVSISPACMMSSQIGRSDNRLTINTAAIIETAIILYRTAMAPVFLQSNIIGPNSFVFSSQACILGELFPKQNAAKITKTVVGSSGRTAPIIPSSKDAIPAINQLPLPSLLIADLT